MLRGRKVRGKFMAKQTPVMLPIFNYFRLPRIPPSSHVEHLPFAPRHHTRCLINFHSRYISTSLALPRTFHSSIFASSRIAFDPSKESKKAAVAMPHVKQHRRARKSRRGKIHLKGQKPLHYFLWTFCHRTHFL